MSEAGAGFRGFNSWTIQVRWAWAGSRYGQSEERPYDAIAGQLGAAGSGDPAPELRVRARAALRAHLRGRARALQPLAGLHGARRAAASRGIHKPRHGA